MILELLLIVFNVSKNIISFGVGLSGYVGEFLVTIGVIIFKFSLQCTLLIGTVLNILHEDFIYFLVDFGVKLTTIFHAICDSVKIINNVTLNVIHKLLVPFIVINSIIQAFTNGCYMLLQTIITMINNIKHYALLLGDAMWLLASLFPQAITNLLQIIIYFNEWTVNTLNEFLNEVMIISKASYQYSYMCVTKVPVQSTVGLFLFIAAIIISVEYGCTIYKNVSRLLVRSWNLSFKKTAVIIRIIFRKRSTTDANISVEVEDNGQMISQQLYNELKNHTKKLEDEKLCIICQEHNKSVLLLPCKHLCLCHECAIRINFYSGNCPVCRCYVRKTIQVYV